MKSCMRIRPFTTPTAESGEYRHVRGYMKAKIVARPGLLTSKDPFYFEADWVEKTPEKYILHDAFITDCEMPNPWWTVHSKTDRLLSARSRHRPRRRLSLPAECRCFSSRTF